MFTLLAQQFHEEKEVQKRNNWTAIPWEAGLGSTSRWPAAGTDWPEAPCPLSLTASPCPAPGLVLKGNPVMSARLSSLEQLWHMESRLGDNLTNHFHQTPRRSNERPREGMWFS